jgi:hypothetical protein
VGALQMPVGGGQFIGMFAMTVFNGLPDVFQKHRVQCANTICRTEKVITQSGCDGQRNVLVFGNGFYFIPVEITVVKQIIHG